MYIYLGFPDISRYRVVYSRATFVKSDADVTNWSWNRRGRTGGRGGDGIGENTRENVGLRNEGKGSLRSGIAGEFQEFTARAARPNFP